MKKWWMAAAMWLVSGVAMAAMAPDQLVKKTADDVIEVIKSDKDIQAGNQQKIFSLAEEKILPNFDFEKVSRLVLGKNWTNASPDQKTAFQAEFKTLLLRTYATALSKYKNQVIEYKPFRMESGADTATVKTAIQQPGGDPIAVDYTLGKKGDDWKVFDIVIEGVSLVTNYRSQFAQEIRQNGLDSLTKKLADKNKAATGK
ncbi:ABC transporter substrate-binding protein [Methylophilus sp. VKM B-3414]|jgi:phospholipid transport system substrate-binding protein|uniref:MlaC/ttg2D family ABC transporter substrate-binding protein n=1 Tax=unclassified Methylophilus TaxID=2630143 RepID=UPI0018902D26|nr:MULTISPECIES: ABC transporter substrate-binding protein [unclassified Methylophilus]MBF5039712.1 ABC transporter substrate-binding protein [Methylophilus sp. 13]MDT7848916.1 ABC transporter substrate-binding protein [Methylophilus sp. VKM B-3414]